MTYFLRSYSHHRLLIHHKPMYCRHCFTSFFLLRRTWAAPTSAVVPSVSAAASASRVRRAVPRVRVSTAAPAPWPATRITVAVRPASRATTAASRWTSARLIRVSTVSVYLSLYGMFVCVCVNVLLVYIFQFDDTFCNFPPRLSSFLCWSFGIWERITGGWKCSYDISVLYIQL